MEKHGGILNLYYTKYRGRKLNFLLNFAVNSKTTLKSKPVF